MADAASARLFLALWPDDDVRARLREHRDAWGWPTGARPVDEASLHLTLHFIGPFARARIDALGAALATVPAGRLVLRGAADALWPGGIAVLRLADDPALATLHRRLGDVLAGFDVALDARPFAPHVTLARKARGAARPEQPAEFEWSADAFSLVESRPGRPEPYAVLRSFAAARE